MLSGLRIRVRALFGRRAVEVEAKEVVAGFLLLADTTLDEVTALARECPNLPNGMTVEIRQLAGACHLARAIGWETMKGPGTA